MLPGTMAIAPPPPHTRPFSELVLDFLAYLELERGLSRNTLEAYRSDLQQFGAWMAEHDVAALTAGRRDLEAFLASMSMAPATTSAQDRLPAVLLPAPAPRGDHRPRSDGRAQGSAPGAKASPGPDPRPRWPAPRSAEGHRPRRAARPRAARADVRVRAARVRGDRPRGRRRRPRRADAAGPRQGLQGAHRARRPPGALKPFAHYVQRGRPALVGLSDPSRRCSSTAAAAG